MTDASNDTSIDFMRIPRHVFEAVCRDYGRDGTEGIIRQPDGDEYIYRGLPKLGMTDGVITYYAMLYEWERATGRVGMSYLWLLEGKPNTDQGGDVVMPTRLLRLEMQEKTRNKGGRRRYAELGLGSGLNGLDIMKYKEAMSLILEVVRHANELASTFEVIVTLEAA